MATRFAVATGNWSNIAIWDNGALPVAGDTVYPNGFTVTIDQDINVDGLNNNTSPVYLPNMPIPLMTGNTQPSGTVFAGQNTSTAYQAFDYSSSTLWQSTNLTNCTIGYQFTSGKIIKRYYLFRQSENQRPITWTFEGSNDGTTYTVLETVTSNTATTPYLSGVLANTTSYTYYRINITAVSSGTVAYVRTLEMTESTGTVYGTTTGGSFTVPASLSGTRNIVQSGAGIISNSSAIVITTAHTSGNTVNFNVQSGGFIFNQNSHTALMANPILLINGNGAVNFNSNVWGSQTAGIYNNGFLININAASTVTVNGNIYAAKGGTVNSIVFGFPATTSNSAILNVNGDLIASNASVNSYCIYSNSLGTTNIVGNIIGDTSPCYYGVAASTLNITGTVSTTNSNSYPAIYIWQTLTTGTQGSLVTINGSITNRGNSNAIMAPKIRFVSTATPYWIYQTNAGTDMTLAYGSATGAYPAEADVRFGVTYAASPTRTGTCRVPLPQYVSQGVLVDATVGTAYLSATDVWNVLTSTLTTAGSIGERLKNASTVQTTGDQLASYQV